MDRLLQKARDAGVVRVLVQLSLPYHPEGYLTGQGAEQQRQAIFQAQDEVLAAVAERDGVSLVRRYTYIPLLTLELDEQALRDVGELPVVSRIQEDTLAGHALFDSIPLIKADQVWASGYTGNGWTVAIIDSGVDRTHPFLSGKVVSEACYSTNSPANSASTVCPNGQTSQTGTGAGVNCPLTVSGCNHGTHVAGIAAGSSASFSGVARDASIIAVQVFSRIDSTSLCGQFGHPSPCALTFTSDYIAGLERVYALRNGFNIAAANMSLGGGQFTSNCDGELAKPAIDLLRSVNIPSIVASGNAGFSNALGSPACISTAISVGNTRKSDVVNNSSNSASFLHLLAPGTDIYSSVAGGGYAFFTGTSMAAPHVAGAWAIHKQMSPGATVTQVLNTLTNTGVPITDGRNGITKPRIEFDIVAEPTATPTGTAMSTATPTATSTPGPGSCNNIVWDGGFEASPPTDWYGSGSTYHYSSDAHSGDHSVLMGYVVSEESTLWQEFNLPANPTSASVYFWYKLTTDETSSTAYDRLIVSVRNQAGTVIWTTVAELDNTNNVDAWTQLGHTLTAAELAAIAGKAARLDFRLTNDFSLVTQVLVDDVVWSLCSGSTTPPTSTPTSTPQLTDPDPSAYLPVIVKQ